MRVFFLTSDWSAMRNVESGASAEPTGQPDLYLPWLRYRSRGHDVRVFYLGKESKSRELYFHGCRLHVLARPAFFRWRNQAPWLRMRFPADQFIMYTAVKAVACKEPPDVVYAVQPWYSYALWALKRRYGCLTVKHIFGTWLYHDWAQSGSTQRRIKCLPHFAAWKVPSDLMIIMNDGTEGDKVAKLLHIPPKRVRFWMNGIDKRWNVDEDQSRTICRTIGVRPNDFVLMCLSRLSPWKRQDRVLQVMPKILADVPNARLVLVGDGRARSALETLADQLNIRDRVVFAGQIAHSSVRDYLGMADVFLQTNDLSCLGNSLLEAVVCGRAIVTWDVGSTRDLIKDGINGLLLPDVEPETLAGAVIDLAKHPEKRKALQDGARHYALENLQSWDERLDKEIDLVESMIRDRK